MFPQHAASAGSAHFALARLCLFMSKRLWLMNRVTSFQREGRDLDVELVPARAGHLIGAAHHTHGGLERAPRGILERFAWREDWLLANHPRSLYFLGVLHSVGDDPMAAEKLNRLGPLIRYADCVLEHPFVLERP